MANILTMYFVFLSLFLPQEFVYTGIWCVFYFVASLTILTNGGVYAAAGVSLLKEEEEDISSSSQVLQADVLFFTVDLRLFLFSVSNLFSTAVLPLTMHFTPYSGF